MFRLPEILSSSESSAKCRDHREYRELLPFEEGENIASLKEGFPPLLNSMVWEKPSEGLAVTPFSTYVTARV
jgi:hypothetical protein